MNKGSIVEPLCSDLDRKEPRYKCPTLLYFTLPVCTHSEEQALILTAVPRLGWLFIQRTSTHVFGGYALGMHRKFAGVLFHL